MFRTVFALSVVGITVILFVLVGDREDEDDEGEESSHEDEGGVDGERDSDVI